MEMSPSSSAHNSRVGDVWRDKMDLIRDFPKSLPPWVGATCKSCNTGYIILLSKRARDRFVNVSLCYNHI